MSVHITTSNTSTTATYMNTNWFLVVVHEVHTPKTYRHQHRSGDLVRHPAAVAAALCSYQCYCCCHCLVLYRSFLLEHLKNVPLAGFCDLTTPSAQLDYITSLELQFRQVADINDKV